MEKLTFKSTVAQALKNPRAVKIAERMYPGITGHPAIRLVSRYSLEKALQVRRLRITPEKLQAFLKEVNGE